MRTQENRFFYLVADEQDEAFGITVTTVGTQRISPQQPYPPVGLHPSSHMFDLQSGRILDEYQLLYITDGQGRLEVENVGEYPITEGKMFLLFPGVRHWYRPLEQTGWTEYWIGFNGEIIEHLARRRFISHTSPLLNIGINERILDLYLKAIGIAREGRAGYQQALAGIVYHLIGLSYYRNRTSEGHSEEVLAKIDKAKVIMHENIFGKIEPEDVAERLNMSYSHFRRCFKDVTGVSPAYYFLELKLNEAKLLLSTSLKPIKEIAFELDFDTADYFSSFFKKRVGVTPLEYRSRSRANGSL